MKRCGWLLLLPVLTNCSPVRADATVYATHALARVRPHDPPLDSPTVTIAAARNEYEPLQVVVRAGSEPLRGVTARIGDLRSTDGAVIASSQVTFYREQYVHVVRSSPRSREGAGWYPDALIPFSAPASARAGGKARFAGAPFDVAPGTNQPVWVDVYVPRDARPATYSGTITVTAEQQPDREIRVELTVWNFALPETPSMRSNFGKLGADIARAHGVEMNSAAFRAPEWEYGRALADHRISPVIPNTLYPAVRTDGSIDPSGTHEALARWIDAFHLTGFPLRLLGDDPAGRDRARNLTHLRAMYAYLEKHGWEDMAYVYVLDEPNDAKAYGEVRRRAKLVHEAVPDLEVLCTEQPDPTDSKWGTLVGSVDIWCPLWTLFDEAAVAERLRAGDEVWSYTALTQGRRDHDTPYWQIDFPLLDFRVPMWISWRYGLTGILYWSPVWWSVTEDAWTDPVTYRAGGDVYNGEGSLFYPGAAAGMDGPVVSMRMKQIREGFEDYEYLKLLADRVGSATVRELVQGIAPSWMEWNADPGALYRTRDDIARRMASAP
jgi:hypothetical protein